MNKNRGGQKLEQSDAKATRNKSDHDFINLKDDLLYAEIQ